MDIHVQRELGKSIREIAKDLGISRNTVRRYLRNPALAPTYPDRRARPTKLDLTAASPSVIWR